MVNLRIILAAFLIVAFAAGCQKEEEPTSVCGGAIEGGKTATLLAIDGQELPYEAVYIDNDNYSLVIGGSLTLYADGTWKSTLENEKKENGITDFNIIRRQGTYDCGFLELTLVNDLNQEAGTVKIVPNATNFTNKITLTSSTNKYTFEAPL